MCNQHIKYLCVSQMKTYYFTSSQQQTITYYIPQRTIIQLEMYIDDFAFCISMSMNGMNSIDVSFIEIVLSKSDFHLLYLLSQVKTEIHLLVIHAIRLLYTNYLIIAITCLFIRLPPLQYLANKLL